MAKKKGQRMGGKFTGSHTTVIAVAGEIADIADQCSVVTKIALGFIKAGLPPSKGVKRLKIVIDEGSLLVTVRGSTAQQELRIYATDTKVAHHAIVTGAHTAGFKVTR
jgi:hypothetical protein